MKAIFKYAITGAAGIIVGALLFSKCGHDVAAPVIITPKEIIKQEAAAEAPYKAKFDSLVISFNKLQVANKSLTAEIATVKKSKSMAEDELNVLLNTLPDTIRVPIINKAITYENLVRVADSLCNSMVANLSQQVINKNEMLIAKDSMYSQLRKSFNFSLAQNQTLIDYSKQLKKDIRKKRAGSFIWKVATGAAVGLLIKQSLK